MVPAAQVIVKGIPGLSSRSRVETVKDRAGGGAERRTWGRPNFRLTFLALHNP